MDTRSGPADSGGMTPLGALIREALDRQHLSNRRLADLGGPAEATTRRLTSSRPEGNRNPPSDEDLQALSRVLRIPLSRIYLAAAQTKGWVPLDAEPTAPGARMLTDALAQSTRRAARCSPTRCC